MQPWECDNYFYYDYEDQHTLTFTGISIWGDIVLEADSYLWDFGDGSTGEGQTITHTFEPNPNEFYIVCLTTISYDPVTGDSCFAESCQDIWLGNQQDCEAFFTYFPADTMNPNPTLQFIDASWGYPDTWAWEFGDGTTSSEQNPLHTFPEEGIYIVTLSIWDSAGSCQSTYSSEVIIGGYILECSNYFYYDYEDQYTLSFIGEAYMLDILIEADSYHWDFGDGTTGEGQTITHTFEPDSIGVYSVCLTTITYDPETGTTCFAESCQDIWLGNQQDCEAFFFYFPADSMNSNLTLQFIDASWGYPDSWAWDFGDGTTSGEQNPLHTFNEMGTYLVTLSIWNSDGTCQSTYTEEVFVGGYIVECSNYFYYDYEDQYTLIFTGEAFWGDMIIEAESYSWDFGDGTTGEGQTITHVFEPNNSGFYTVCLTTISINPDGETCTAESCQEVFITNSNDVDLWGQVLAGDNIADIGLATLFAHDSNTGEVFIVDVQAIDSAGYYFFFDVPGGSYLLLTELLPGSAYYNDWLPTYYGDVLYWEDATEILTEDLSNPYNVNLVAADGYYPGQGLINGTITEEGRFKGDGLPAMDINIILFDQYMNALGYMYSTEQGTFDFTDLPYGTYYIYAEIIGMATNPIMVVLHEDNPTATIDLVMSGDQLGVLSTNELSSENFGINRIYPNPAREVLNIELFVKNSKLQVAGCRLQVYDVNGRLMEELQITENMTSTIKIDLQYFSSGIYSVLLRNSTQIISRDKFVVVE